MVNDDSLVSTRLWSAVRPSTVHSNAASIHSVILSVNGDHTSLLLVLRLRRVGSAAAQVAALQVTFLPAALPLPPIFTGAVAFCETNHALSVPAHHTIESSPHACASASLLPCYLVARSSQTLQLVMSASETFGTGLVEVEC